jgi:hypothetical protein
MVRIKVPPVAVISATIGSVRSVPTRPAPSVSPPCYTRTVKAANRTPHPIEAASASEANPSRIDLVASSV